ncbi:MAG TPA: knotted carbamoyltransferase YgeW [Thermoanaerobaculia bacterium]|nr:knotted carbamoyltransferase YgeW [Thermoanaerobaculia bacterium]
MTRQQLAPWLESLDDEVLATLRGRSMLLTSEWTRDEIDGVCNVAAAFEQLDRRGIPIRLLPDELHYALFFDNSTRTKSSWAGAAVRLGAHPMVVDGSSTQVAHGETPEETGAMLGMNAHALGIRHDLIVGEGNRFMRAVKNGIDGYLREGGETRSVPIVNLQCDVDHPTQTLADLAFLRERFPDGLAGKTMAVSWAYSPSYAKPLSVPQGLIMLMTRFGMNVRLAHPPGYDLMPDTIAAAKKHATQSGGTFKQVATMDEAFEGADIVYPKSWGPYDLMLERVTANRNRDQQAMKDIETRALARNRNHTDWIADERRMKRTGNALYMHCLPADIGAEVAHSVLERFRFSLAREANKKLYVIMALLAVAKVDRLRERLTSS